MDLYEYEIDEIYECMKYMKYNYLSGFSNQRTAESTYVDQSFIMPNETFVISDRENLFNLPPPELINLPKFQNVKSCKIMTIIQ